MRPKFADAIIISTQDNLHYDPCMQALKMGLMYYWKTLSHQVKKKAVIFCSWRKTGRIVAVCHVLRYPLYFIKLKGLMNSSNI